MRPDVRPMTLEGAVALLRESPAREWDLVAEAQQLVARRMAYSRRNSWDSPARAFERGMGYCHQRALALQAILTSLGVESRPVAARRCRFPAAHIHEYVEPEHVSGHVWLRVTIDGRERDVCPGDVANTPGQVAFTVLSPTREYRGLRRLGGQLGSIGLNWSRDRAARRRSREGASQESGRRRGWGSVVAIVGVIVAVLGLLWLLQGLGAVRLCPVLCFVDCKCVSGSSASWAAGGAITLAVGMGIVFVGWRRVRSLRHS